MTHAIRNIGRNIGQDFASQHFDVVGNCYVAEHHVDAYDEAQPHLHETHEPGAMLALFARLTGIVVVRSAQPQAE
jgi:hypothetical protein